jgi:hypothetical protein
MDGRTCVTNVVDVGAGELLLHTFELFLLFYTLLVLFENGMILSLTLQGGV